jgi:hypothetical protein
MYLRIPSFYTQVYSERATVATAAAAAVSNGFIIIY